MPVFQQVSVGFGEEGCSRLRSLGALELLECNLSFQGSPAFEDPGEGPGAWAAEGPQK